VLASARDLKFHYGSTNPSLASGLVAMIFDKNGLTCTARVATRGGP
jgi:hypothetical protein